MLVKNKKFTLSGLAQELDEQAARLDTLDTTDVPTGLRQVFEASYSRLSADGQKAFRFLGMRQGQGIDAYAVALLTHGTVTNAKSQLRELCNVGLVEEDAGRYTVHDLLHQYASERLTESDPHEAQRAVAFDRAVNGYYGCVNYAFDLRNPKNPMVDSDYLEDEWEQTDPFGKQAVKNYRDAAHWFAAEQSSLGDLVQRASTMRWPPVRAPHLAFSMFYFLDISGHWTEWEQVTDRGYAMALKLNNIWAQARLKRNVARLKWVRVRDYSDELRLDTDRSHQADEQAAKCDEAIRIYEESNSLYDDCAPKKSREAATVKRELADVYLELARLHPSDTAFERARVAYLDAQELFSGEENPIASLSVPLSMAYRHLGRHDDAQICLDTALGFASPPDDQSDPIHKGTYCFGLLRQAELLVDRYDINQKQKREEKPSRDDVLTAYDRAITAFHDHNYWRYEARTLAWKGTFLASVGRTADAITEWMRARDIFTSHKSGEGKDEGRVVQAWIDEPADIVGDPLID